MFKLTIQKQIKAPLKPTRKIAIVSTLV